MAVSEPLAAAGSPAGSLEPPRCAVVGSAVTTGRAHVALIWVMLAGAALRLAGLTRPYLAGGSPAMWRAVPWPIYLVPSAAVVLAASGALVAGATMRRAATCALVGLVPAIALQMLLRPGQEPATGLEQLSAGAWLTVVGGAAVVVAGVALVATGRRTGRLPIGHRPVRQQMREPVMPLIVAASVLTAFGAPGASSVLAAHRSWATSSSYGALDAPFAAVTTALCLLVPVAVGQLRTPAARAGLCAGWSAALGGWLIGLELATAELPIRFRLLEAGVVLVAVAALLLLAEYVLPVRPFAVVLPPTTPPPPPPPPAPPPASASHRPFHDRPRPAVANLARSGPARTR